MLNWDKLLCAKRERESSSIKPSGLIKRNEFESDYDRIIGSSSVRRLQDKAQVFPLQENDVTRTRLTHSIEVSSMARSLGKAVGSELVKKNKFPQEQVDQLQALLQTAGLIHDLGNPPFGHYGEKIIRNWFSEYFKSNSFLKANGTVLTEQQKNDFLFFDGNVQNIRIITKLQTLNDQYGANFTYATIASIIKYPWKSDNTKCINEKGKFGYFHSEEQQIEKIRLELGLKGCERHPATLLMEAADDIIYICDDIEDGVKKGCIDWDIEYNKLKESLKAYGELFEKIDSKIPDANMDHNEQVIARVRNFRNAVQSHLFVKAVENFINNYDKIINGNFIEELLFTEKVLIKELKKLTAKTCFSSKEVIRLELVGDKVVSTLLDIFVPTIIEHDGAQLLDTSTYAGKLFNLISPNFTYIALYPYLNGSDESAKEKAIDKLSLYERMHIVVDFISGMTDSFAVNIYKELMGISL